MLVAPLLFLLLASCSSAPPPPTAAVPAEPEYGGWLVTRLDSDPATFNWVETNHAPTLQVGRLVSDSLVAVRRDLSYGPELAVDWSFSDEGRTLTFRLRPGVRWQDGLPFTSDDVIFTYQRAVDPEGGNAAATYFTDVESVTAPDPLTVQVRYHQAIVTALQGWERLLILPRHVWEGVPAMRGLEVGLAVGTGPFRLVSWDAGQQLTLAANDDYWGQRPYLDRMVFKIIQDDATSFEALRADEIDLAPISSSTWPAARALGDQGRLRFLRFQLLHLVYIAWNGDGSNPFFTDRRVRRAMTQALDREGFVRSVLNGLGQVATSTFVPGTWAHDASLEPLPYDPDEAGRLLDEAGWVDHDGDGIRDRDGVAFRFTLDYYNTNANARTMGELLQASLSKLGIEMTLRPLERAAFTKQLRGRQFQAQLSAWKLDLDPDPFDFWHSSQSPAGANYAGYADDEVDRLCEQGRREFDPAKRAALYARLQEILQRDQPFTFLYHIERVIGMQPRVQGVEASPVGIWQWYPSTLGWWIPAGQRRFAGGEHGAAQGG